MLLGPDHIHIQLGAIAEVGKLHRHQRARLQQRRHQRLRQPAPANAGADHLQGSQVVVGAPDIAGIHQAFVAQRPVTAGDDDLACIGQVVLAQLGPGCIARRGGMAQRLHQRVAGGDDGQQGLGRHFLKTFAAIEAGPLKHQRQLRAVAVQHGQGIGLRGGQHFHRQLRVLLRQGRQGCCPRRGHQLGCDGDGQPRFQPLLQGQRMGVELLELRGQQACLRLQRQRGGQRLGLPALTGEQRHLQLGFELGDLHADSRGHLAQRPCSC